MPRASTARRGGKRPGAGAPKGNFNAMRSGNRSRRMLMVYLAVVNHPDRLALGRDLLEQGFLHPPRGPRRTRFNGDVRGVVTYLYRKWFDCPDDEQSHSIKDNQPATPVTPPVESETAPAPLQIARHAKNASEQRTIKARHVAGLPAIAAEDEIQ